MGALDSGSLSNESPLALAPLSDRKGKKRIFSLKELMNRGRFDPEYTEQKPKKEEKVYRFVLRYENPVENSATGNNSGTAFWKAFKGNTK